MNTTVHIKTNIQRIQKELPKDVILLAAVKTRTVSEVEAAYAAGIRYFGHNYIQELQAMAARVPFKACWHVIGHLQRNKVKHAVPLADMIESVDSLRLAKELEKRCTAIGKIMPVLIEVNSGKEENKTGIMPNDVMELAKWISGQAYIKLVGLMTMVPLTGDPELSRPYFKETRRILNEIKNINIPRVNIRYLSMGMSHTYRVAVQEGANIIRLGTAIFGPRGT